MNDNWINVKSYILQSRLNPYDGSKEIRVISRDNHEVMHVKKEQGKWKVLSFTTPKMGLDQLAEVARVWLEVDKLAKEIDNGNVD